jgi:hypothetical protein
MPTVKNFSVRGKVPAKLPAVFSMAFLAYGKKLVLGTNFLPGLL